MHINFHGDVLAIRTHCNFIISFTYLLILVKNTTSFEVFTAVHLKILVVFWNVIWFPIISKEANGDQPYYCVSKCGTTLYPGQSCTSLSVCPSFHIATNGHIIFIQLCYSTVFGTLHGHWTPEDKMYSSKMLKQLTQ